MRLKNYSPLEGRQFALVAVEKGERDEDPKETGTETWALRTLFLSFWSSIIRVRKCLSKPLTEVQEGKNVKETLVMQLSIKSDNLEMSQRK